MWDAIASFFEFLTEILRRTSTQSNIKSILAIYDEMKRIIVNTNAERVIIFKLENGGGIIKPGAQLKASIIYEDFEKDKFESVKDRLQDVKLDSEGLNILSQCIDKKSIKIDTNSMQPVGLLYDLWRTEGVQYLEMYHLLNSRKAVFFCSIGTKEKDEKFDTGGQHSEFSLSINKIRSLLSGKKVKIIL